jgi:glucose/arabinose dehydrogenase
MKTLVGATVAAGLGLAAGAALIAAAQESRVLGGPGAEAPQQADPRFTVETIAEGFATPWSLAFLPDGRMLVTERPGTLRLVTADGLAPDPVEGLPDDIYFDRLDGLFDVVLHPDFAENRLVYFVYSTGDARVNAIRAVRGRLEEPSPGRLRLADVEMLFEARSIRPAPMHAGGRLVFLPDGTFVMTLGDGVIWREDALRMNTVVGKSVRLNADGTVPADNPFVGQENVRPEIYTIGHRNPLGLAWDPVRGVLYQTENGPWGGDELNALKPGAHYGWPAVTHGRDYNGAWVTPYETYPGVEEPLVDWTPVIAASGLAVYHGGLFPEWDGDVLAGGLGARAVVRVEIDPETGAAREAERLFGDLRERIRDVREGPDGAIYLVTDHPRDGKVLRVTPAD